MADRETVMTWLEICGKNDDCSGCCPYDGGENFDCVAKLMADALALLKEQEAAYRGAVELLRQKTILFDDAIKRLKEQEPKQIVRKQVKRKNSDGSIDDFAEWRCPHCGKVLDRASGAPWIEFCYKCGKPILWECR